MIGRRSERLGLAERELASPTPVSPATGGRWSGEGLLGKVALLLFGLLLPLLVLEAALRLAGPILPGFYRTGTDLVVHPVFGHFHQPSFVGWRKTAEFTVQERINSKGLRERELPYEKPPRTGRVLMLGDSFVEAVQVEAGQTVSSRLEGLLNEGGARAEVINGGVGGFGTAQAWLFFRDEGYRYSPDLVLLVVYLGNDVRNNSSRLDNDVRLRTEPYFALESDGSLRQLDLSAKRAPREGAGDQLKRVLRASALFNVFETGVLEKLDGDEDVEEGYSWSKNERVFQARYTRDWEEAWEITEALLAQVKREVEGRGGRLVLVAAPSDLQVRPADWERILRENSLPAKDFDLEKPNRLLAEIAGRQMLPLIDLLPEFRRAEAASAGGLFFRQNRHWTPEGHQVAAAVIRDELRRLGLTPAAR